MWEPAAFAMHDKTGPSFQFSYPQWQPLVQAALMELDPIQLRERIQVAETAIAVRLGEIGSNPADHAERYALADAVASLRFLKREQGKTPDETA